MDNKKKYKNNNVTSATNLSSEVVSALVNSVLKNHKINNNNSNSNSDHNLLTKNSSDSDSEKEMENKNLGGGREGGSPQKSINQIEKSYLIQIL